MTPPETARLFRSTLKAIESGLAADNIESGDFFAARRMLDRFGVYHDNLSGTRVLLELARVALQKGRSR